MDFFDVIVIGAGPAGLFCAINCAANGLKVCVFEKNGFAGKKLLLSGAGRCNLTHGGAIADFLGHYGDNARFVKGALYGFSNSDLIDFFRKRGLKTLEDAGGRIFPVTSKGSDVLRVMIDECDKNSVIVRYNEPILTCRKTGPAFEIATAKAGFGARAIMIATGGAAYPATGSTGDGYAFAKQFGHTIADIAPALAPIIIRDYQFVNCAGISMAGTTIALYRNGAKQRAIKGDVLFTHTGLSGPGILDLSRYITPGDTITVGLVKYAKKEEFEKELIDEFSNNGRQPVIKCLGRYKVPERILLRVFEQQGIPAALNCASIDKKTRQQVIDSLMECPFEVERIGDFNEAMVTRGGVSVREIDPVTMESRLIRGLFFGGEVIDIDGDTGGYNLQFAFSSGMASAKGIAVSLGLSK